MVRLRYHPGPGGGGQARDNRRCGEDAVDANGDKSGTGRCHNKGFSRALARSCFYDFESR